MKKVLIISLIVLVIVLADILFRQLDTPENNKDVSVSEKQVSEKQDSKKLVSPKPISDLARRSSEKIDPDQEKKGAGLEKRGVIVDDRQNTEPSKSKTPAEACLEFSKKIIANQKFQYSKEDLNFIDNLNDKNLRQYIVQILHEFIGCKAIELQNYTLCDEAKKHFMASFDSPANCSMMYKIFIPLRASFSLKMTPEQFADLYEDDPQSIREWMQEFIEIIDSKNPDRCSRLADDPFTMEICRIAAGGVKKVPKGELKEAFYIINTIKSGQLSLLGGLQPNGIGEALAKASLNVPNSCDEYFSKAMDRYCKKGSLQKNAQPETGQQ